MHSRHGSKELRHVTIDSYNIELRHGDGFLGDRANKRVFQAMLENHRQRLRRDGGDPLDGRPTADLYKDKTALADIIAAGDPEAAGVLLGTLDEFARELVGVVERLLETPEWQGTQCIAIGGGFREGRFGELVVGRTAVILKSRGTSASLVPVRYHPEEAGLIGALQLAPDGVLDGFNGILAVDIGGTNVRTAVVEAESGDGPATANARVWAYELWRHADGTPSREELLGHMLERLTQAAACAANEEFALAPVIAIACPGVIAEDGRILRGAQNLPGQWEGFNLAEYVRGRIPRIAGRETVVVIHNDAVVQGLSEYPEMKRLAHWGVLTIGTGLGNARFTNRRRLGDDARR